LIRRRRPRYPATALTSPTEHAGAPQIAGGDLLRRLGEVTFKINADVFKAGAGTAARLAPQDLRSVHNHGAGDAVLVLCSVRIEDTVADALTEDDFWPEG
jgi:hypothetical protein